LRIQQYPLPGGTSAARRPLVRFFPATPGAAFGCEDHVADEDDDVAEAARKALTLYWRVLAHVALTLQLTGNDPAGPFATSPE
jgi:hypothetical protein